MEYTSCNHGYRDAEGSRSGVSALTARAFRDREVACSASDRQGSNFESCDWRTVSSQSSHHPQEVLLAQFSLYVHKGGLKPDPFHFYFVVRADSKHETLKQFRVNVRSLSATLFSFIRSSKNMLLFHNDP